MHVSEVIKKARIAMAQIWGIGRRKFKNNFERRMRIFRSIVKSILMYASEIWGWMVAEKVSREATEDMHKVDFRFRLRYINVPNFGENQNGHCKDRSWEKGNEI